MVICAGLIRPPHHCLLNYSPPKRPLPSPSLATAGKRYCKYIFSPVQIFILKSNLLSFSNSVPGLHLPSPPTSPPPPQQPPHHSRPREHNVKSPTKAYQPAENTPYLAPSSEVASAPQQTFTSVLNVFHDAQTNSFNQ